MPSFKHTQRITALALLAICGYVVLACGTTSGVKISFSAAAVGSLTNGKPVTTFTNRRGWQIKLKRAHMLVGPFYLYEGDPQITLWEYLQPCKVAFAHVNANGQRVLSEIREHFVVDLLQTAPTSLGKMRGIEGNTKTAEMLLLPPGGTRLAKDSLALTHVNGATIFAEGIATKDKETRPFELKLTLPTQQKNHVIKDITAAITLKQNKLSTGKLQLNIYVDRWFTNVAFDQLTKQNKEGRFRLDQNNNAILQGVRSRYSYHITWR